MEILKTYQDDVTLIAETLLKQETINAEEIAYLLEHRELPKTEPTLSTDAPIEEETVTVEETKGDEGKE